MPNSSETIILAKNGHPPGDEAAVERTPGLSWLTVLIGGVLLAGNVIELGGVLPASREWTAWLLAALVFVHGLAVGWGMPGRSGLRLPKWPLAGLPIILALGLAWLRDGDSPELSRGVFFLAGEAWLLCWVVAATPGGRSLSWAWLVILAAVALIALIAATGWQAFGNGLWLPMGRTLPHDWEGRWTGTLPTPAAFGGLMVLSAPPLLVMACSHRLPSSWRLLCAVAGAFLCIGAAFSFSLGAWLGLAGMLFMLPVIIGGSRTLRLLGYAAGGLSVMVIVWMWSGPPLEGPLATAILGKLRGGEPSLLGTLAAIGATWDADPALGAHGASIATFIHPWRYGFSDWTELAAVWGILGLALTAGVCLALMTTAWVSWAKLPFLVTTEVSANGGAAARGDYKSFTPETKMLLGAMLAGFSAFIAAMGASRLLNIPAVMFAFAVMAGLMARNLPQRGGILNVEPPVRRALALGASLILAIVLVAKVAPIANAHDTLLRVLQPFELDAVTEPGLLTEKPDLLAQFDQQLHESLALDPANVHAWTLDAWVKLEKSRVDPASFDRLSKMADASAQHATELAPAASEPLLALAVACLLNNRVAQAERNVCEALHLAPADPQTRYYAIAVLAIDPANRRTAKMLLETASVQTISRPGHAPTLSEDDYQKFLAVYDAAVASDIPPQGLRERPLPPYFPPTRLWPPLAGMAPGEPAAPAPAK